MWKNMAQHGLSLTGSDTCHTFVTVAPEMVFFITRTHPCIRDDIIEGIEYIVTIVKIQNTGNWR